MEDMGLNGDQKTQKVLRILQKIANKSDLEITPGGKHNYKLKCIHTGNTYPLPANHRKFNKFLVREVGKWLERNDICTFEEYEKYF